MQNQEEESFQIQIPQTQGVAISTRLVLALGAVRDVLFACGGHTVSSQYPDTKLHLAINKNTPS